MNMHQVGRSDAIPFQKHTFVRKFLDVKIIPITESEIKSIIHSNQETCQIMMK
jgi:hypothetical protein